MVVLYNFILISMALIIRFLQSEMHIGAELGGQFAVRVGHLSPETVPMSTICLRKLWELTLSMTALWLRLQVWFMCLQLTFMRKGENQVESAEWQGVSVRHQFVHCSRLYSIEGSSHTGHGTFVPTKKHLHLFLHKIYLVWPVWPIIWVAMS